MFARALVPVVFGPIGDRLHQFATFFDNSIRVPPDELAGFQGTADTLLVTDRLAGYENNFHVLLPQGADGFKFIADPTTGRDHMVILVPFGSGESGIQALRLALQLTKATDAAHVQSSLLLYHTTWRKPGEESADGWQHLSDEAREIAVELKTICGSEGVPHTFKIQIAAETVPQGIVSCALNNRVSVIVMARGQQVRIGSYVDQMATLSPVPLLIARKEVTS